MIRFVQRRQRQLVQPIAAPRGHARAKTEIQPPSMVGHPKEDSLYPLLTSAMGADRGTASALIAVIVPVLARPHRVPLLVESFRRATADRDAALYFVAQASDIEEVDAICAQGLDPLLVDDVDRSWARKINRGFERTDEPWLLLGADDLAFHPQWVDRVRSLLHSHGGVIGTNDLGNSSTIRGSASTHSLVRRCYGQIFGTADERNKIVHEGYDHNFPDTELVETAKARGLYVHKHDCVIEHLHPLWGKGTTDHVYQLGAKHWAADEALHRSRCKQFGI